MIPGQFAAIIALNSYIHGATWRIHDGISEHFYPSDIAVVRSIYEAAMTAVWLAKEPEAVNAWTRELSRNRKRMRHLALRSSNFADMADIMDLVEPDPSWPEASEASAAEARNVEALARRFPLADAYILYKMLCEMTHPTVALVDQYLSPGTGEAGFAFHVHGRPRTDDIWAWLVAVCALWSSRLVDHYTPGSPHRSRLRAIARQLDVPADIELLPREAKNGQR